MGKRRPRNRFKLLMASFKGVSLQHYLEGASQENAHIEL
jgi:hypothetical protein